MKLLMMYILLLLVIQILTTAGSDNPAQHIPLDIVEQHDSELQIKAFDDIILHDYGGYRFHLINPETMERRVLNYGGIKLELPAPVSRRVAITDFTQLPDGTLLVSESNTSSLYVLYEDNQFEQAAALEDSPFSVALLGDHIIVAANNFEFEYLRILDKNYNEIDKVNIGRSYFHRGVKSMDRRVAGNALFTDHESLYINTNEGSLKKCGFAENGTGFECHTVIETRDHLYLSGSSDDGFLYIKNDSLFLDNEEHAIHSEVGMNFYNSFTKGRTLYQYTDDSISIIHY